MMKTKLLLVVLTAIYFEFQTAPIRAQNGSEVQPLKSDLLRWNRYKYDIESSYPYLKELPDWSKIPILLEWMNREDGDAGIEVAYSQLVALARADFKRSLYAPGTESRKEAVKYFQSKVTEAWTRWWRAVGQPYGEHLRNEGRQNPVAWKLVTREKAQLPPDYKIVIPEEWTLRTSYRAGDYDGVQTESVTLHRSREKATLIRTVRKSTQGSLEWEQWEPLTIEQADNFAFAMAYAIDNPWLLEANGDKNTQTQTNRSESPWLKRLEGRNLTIYYPHFQYEFSDSDGKVWWNDDPTYWYGGDRFKDAVWLGSVCRLLWRTFPDNSQTNSVINNGRWRAAPTLDAAMLQSIADDLFLRGEIISTLWFEQRISDGLETLAKVGTPAQLSAIRQLEANLPIRVEKVKRILERDPNGKLPRLKARRLLTAAANAKAAIQNRSKNEK